MLFADLHIHSRFSQGTSKYLTFQELDFWARKKGLNLLGTGDCTHALWLQELKDNLIYNEEKALYTNKENTLSYILQGEISCVYKQNNKGYRVHNLVFLPHFEAAEKLRKKLEKIGNIESDGRPILKLSSRNLLEIILEIPQSFLIPAHIWTPWYSLFGQRSGFERVEECFQDLTSHIFALETGLSSDIGMNRKCLALNPYSFISNSDAHSGQKLAREVNIFLGELNYQDIFKSLHYETRDNADLKCKFVGTAEVYPQHGKYYTSGHRACNIRFEEENTEITCPHCNKKITEGVAQRVHYISQQEVKEVLPIFQQKEFHFLPLAEILSHIYNCGESSKKIQNKYNEITQEYSELDILLNVNLENISDENLRNFLYKMRNNEIKFDAGYDGVYGKLQD